jgi:hypothetical protein
MECKNSILTQILGHYAPLKFILIPSGIYVCIENEIWIQAHFERSEAVISKIIWRIRLIKK